MGEGSRPETDHYEIGIMMESTMTIDLDGCARCHGEGHHGLVFIKLTHAMNEFTYWAPCPTNGEPIMLKYVVHESSLLPCPECGCHRLGMASRTVYACGRVTGQTSPVPACEIIASLRDAMSDAIVYVPDLEGFTDRHSEAVKGLPND